MATTKNAAVHIRLESLHAPLKKAAKENQRTLAGEIRVRLAASLRAEVK